MVDASAWGTWSPGHTSPAGLVIFGVGETARLAWEYFTYDSPHDVVAFVVTPEFLQDRDFCGLPVMTPQEAIERFSPETHSAFAAASSTDKNMVRRALCDLASDCGYTLTSYVSSRAFIATEVSIGRNCFILEGNVIQTGVSIGSNTTLWSGNHIGHRSTVGCDVFIASHVVISGFCTIGDRCFIGVNAAMADQISLGSDCVLAMGAALRSSTRSTGIYAGNPARPVPQRQPRNSDG
jgi:sugar O-acyltransferase (sialic acid O-acetyltransferase NeuD family)